MSYLGSRQAGKSAKGAANTAAEADMAALDYQKQVERMPLAMRDKFLPMLADYYGGGEGQQALIDDVKGSPMYGEMIKSGQEGVLDRAGSMGLSRSGNTASDLNRSNQGVLQNLTNQRLMGMSSLANQPLNTNAIASTMSGIGRNQAYGQTAAANAHQQGYGGMFQAMLQGMNNG